ncbi:MAG: phosphatase PAP2 family protein [Bacilli bacterium]
MEKESLKDKKRPMKKNVKRMILKGTIWFAVLLLVFGLMLVIWHFFKDNILTVDYKLKDYITNYMINDNNTKFMKIISLFGSKYTLIVIMVIGCIFMYKRRYSIFLALNLFVVYISGYVFKHIACRPRPSLSLIAETGYSFPSGHVMCSTAFYGMLLYFIFKYVKSIPFRWILSFVISLLVVFIGISRLYLGVHHLSDVIGGFILGGIVLIMFISMAKEYFKEDK